MAKQSNKDQQPAEVPAFIQELANYKNMTPAERAAFGERIRRNADRIAAERHSKATVLLDARHLDFLEGVGKQAGLRPRQLSQSMTIRAMLNALAELDLDYSALSTAAHGDERELALTEIICGQLMKRKAKKP